MNLFRSALIPALAIACAAQSADYGQPFRPQYHFSPQHNWTNDPNGLVYFQGEYHLFFQYNPFGDEWGHMSWGHAVSRDLLHWQELPVAIPESDGVMIYTGSTVVDEQNSSGFCKSGACLVAIYTGQNAKRGNEPGFETQNLAYSNDRGRTWTKYSGNPVLNRNMTDFRDPKVFWSAQARHWVMVVALPNEHKALIYNSPDLKQWTQVSEFGPAGATGGQWECPELFELPVDGTRETRWVLKIGVNPGALQGGSGEQYFVGRFEGSHFTNDNPASTTLWTDYGKDCYCALTFNNLPHDKKPVMIGWMNNWQYAAKVPTSPWRGQMTIPRELSLRKTPDGIRLFQAPTEQLEELFDTSSDQIPASHSFVLAFSLNPRAGHEVGLKILSDKQNYTAIGYDPSKRVLFVDRTHSGLVNFSPDFPARLEAPLKPSGDSISMRVVVDRLSVEVFADDGRVVSTNLVFPPQNANTIESFGGKIAAVVETVKSTH